MKLWIVHRIWFLLPLFCLQNWLIFPNVFSKFMGTLRVSHFRWKCVFLFILPFLFLRLLPHCIFQHLTTPGCTCIFPQLAFLTIDVAVSTTERSIVLITIPEDITMAFSFCSTLLFKFIPKQLIYTKILKYSESIK